MRRLFLLLPVAATAVMLLVGCAPQPVYYAPPPPPPPSAEVPPLVRLAHENGFRAGFDDGARDLNRGYGYHPQGDRRFGEAPGYDPNLGPRGPYVQEFRNSYLRGYDKAFYRR